MRESQGDRDIESYFTRCYCCGMSMQYQYYNNKKRVSLSKEKVNMVFGIKKGIFLIKSYCEKLLKQKKITIIEL